MPETVAAAGYDLETLWNDPGMVKYREYLKSKSDINSEIASIRADIAGMTSEYLDVYQGDLTDLYLEMDKQFPGQREKYEDFFVVVDKNGNYYLTTIDDYDAIKYTAGLLHSNEINDLSLTRGMTIPEQAPMTVKQINTTENNYFNLRGFLDSKGYTYNDYTTLSKYLGGDDKAINAMKTKDKEAIMRMILLQKDKSRQLFMPSQQNLSSAMGGNSGNVNSSVANNIANNIAVQSAAQNAINNIDNYSHTSNPPAVSQENLSSNMGGNSGNVSSSAANIIANNITTQSAPQNAINNIQNYSQTSNPPAVSQENLSSNMGGNSGMVDSATANAIADAIAAQKARTLSNNSTIQGNLADDIEKEYYLKRKKVNPFIAKM